MKQHLILVEQSHVVAPGLQSWTMDRGRCVTSVTDAETKWSQNEISKTALDFVLAAGAEQAEANVEQVAVRGGWLMTCFRGSQDQVLCFSLLLYLLQPAPSSGFYKLLHQFPIFMWLYQQTATA